MRTGLIASVMLYLISLVLPAFESIGVKNYKEQLWGAVVLAVGWAGGFGGIYAWYANLFWLFGLAMAYWRIRVAVVVSGAIAVALAASALTLVGQALPCFQPCILTRFLPGYYVWIASLITLPVAALLPQNTKPSAA